MFGIVILKYRYYFQNSNVFIDSTLLLKGNAQFTFLTNPQKSSVNFCLMKIFKSTVTQNVIVCFYNLGEENFNSSSFCNISNFNNGFI